MRALGLLAILISLLSAPVAAQKAVSGAAAIQLALDQLNTSGSALMIAAHPDDENTALLAWLARGRHVRTGYLSMTRGEGGQNLIGAEQGYLLGLIRTQELLAARRIDGAEQFFTRAVDFGFSKTVAETLGKWGHEQALSDVVYVIRKFRPDVIILRFSGTPRDGHGHHQTSAILGREAFAAAADPNRFPEQLKEVQPWQAKRLVWNVFAFTREQEKAAEALPGRIEVDLGAYDPLLGHSYAEIAGMSRSQHHSQGMGSPERRGAQKNYLAHVAGTPATKDLFDGIELDAGIPLLAKAARTFEPRRPEKIIPLLLQARPQIRNERTRDLLDETIAMCAGLWLDASTDRPMAAAGSKVRITTQAVNRSPVQVELVSVAVTGLPPASTVETLKYNQPASRTFDWTAAPPDRNPLRYRPEQPPILTAKFALRIDGAPLELERPVIHRYVDKVRGELTRPFVVVPPVSLHIVEPVSMFPAATARTVTVQVKAWGGKRGGSVRLNVPSGWKADPASRAFDLAQDGQEATLRFEVTPPPGESVAEATAIATADGKEFASGVLVINYPHIPPQTVFPDSEARLVRTPVEVTARRVGYIMGAGDEVPEALRQIGCIVSLLSPEDLTRADFSVFDAVVTGVRAYNTRPDLRANQHRLLDYVRNGGALIVQYNVLEGGFMGGDPKLLEGIGPWPLKISRERVTVEDAPVEILKPAHPLLTWPNRITATDWTGWVQERGLYFASEWASQYEPVISTHDPGEKPLPGGMLYARYGKGAYVFTAYSWFRQLPAGVPGAYRIFANLLSAGGAR